MRGIPRPALSLLLPIVAAAVAHADCTSAWIDQFPYDQFDDTVYASIVFDDGTGPALYVGGEFTNIGGIDALSVARWDGQRWSAVGHGLTGGSWIPRVNAFTVWETPAGLRLIAGGQFGVSGSVQDLWNVAAWDGESWQPIGEGVRSSESQLGVTSLAIFDGPSGPTPHAGGDFPSRGNLVRLEGSVWLGFGGVSSRVYALTVFDDGDGPALYAGGNFTQAGPVSASNIVKWDGVNWSPLGTGLSGSVRTLVAGFESGPPVLYAGGSFNQAGSITAPRIAKWDGHFWSSIGAGIPGDDVYSMLPALENGNTVLYVGGDFSVGSGGASNNIAKWTGEAWVSGGFLGGFNDSSVQTLCMSDFNGQPTLHAGGLFRYADGHPARNFSRFGASGWENVGREHGVAHAVLALHTHDDGSGNRLYAAGNFDVAGNEIANAIAQWDGFEWTPVGALTPDGTSIVIRALATSDVGGIHALYAAGQFTSIADIAARNIAAWNGATWSPLGSGTIGQIFAVAEFDDGTGPALYVGGAITQAGGIPVNRVARWNGSAWSALGAGLSGTGARVNSLCVFDDGDGLSLYAGGQFQTSGATSVPGIARWTGSEWVSVGSGVVGRINAMVAYDFGRGAALYVAGALDFAGGVPVEDVACWSGLQWSALGQGIGAQSNSEVFALAADPAGLYFGGRFGDAGGIPVNNVTRFDGQGWQALASGLNAECFAITSTAAGLPAGVFFGGDFTSADGSSAGRVARWSPALPADIDGNLNVDLADLARLLAHFGTQAEAAFPDGDLDGDGDVDITDLAFLLGNFGLRCS